MSYDTAAAFDDIQNGQALDAGAIEASFDLLSEMARCLASDLLGGPCWLTGGDVTGTPSGNDLFAEVAAGDGYVTEDGSLTHRAITVATRVRQPQRSIQVDQGTDRLLSFDPNAADDRLAALIQTDGYDVLPPEGSVPIAWCGVGFTDLHAVIDARPHPVTGVLVHTSGTSTKSRLIWVPITDGKLAVVLYPGEQLEVAIALTAKDGLVAGFANTTRLTADRYDMTQVSVTLNGQIIDNGAGAPAPNRGHPIPDSDDALGSLLGVAFATAVMENRTFYAEWVLDPFLPNGGVNDGSPATGATLAEQVFLTPDVTQGGPLLVELITRGFDVSIADLWFGLRVRPKERIPT